MKYKITISLLICVYLFGSAGCNDWLDVTPEAQVNQKTMFSTPQGFRDHLFGIYLTMTETSLYGCDMTYGFMDVLAQYYTAYQNNSHRYYEVAQYNYENERVKEQIKAMWATAYNAIANCNLLLENLKARDASFFPDGDKALIEAEALGLRAFLHFDMLRAFAPSYGDGNGQGIPYADRFTNEVFPFLTAKEAVGRIVADLGKAAELLKDFDPVLEDAYKELNYHFDNPSDYDNPFLCYRAYRMNYYAVVASMARVYFYVGDEDGAYRYAMEIIKAADEGYFAVTKESELSAALTSRDVVMQNEVIFALNDQMVHKIYDKFNQNASTAFEVYALANLYPAAMDFRRVYLTANNSRYYPISLKYADVSSSKGKKIPLLRLSEMYYIACEAGFRNHKAEVVSLFDEICTLRGTPTTTGEVDREDFVRRVMLEARREFLGEGQYFFWCKRLNQPIYRGTVPLTLTPKQFTLPLPIAEEEYRK